MTSGEKEAVEEQIRTLEKLAKSERDYANRESCWIRRDAAIARAEKYESQIRTLKEELNQN